MNTSGTPNVPRVRHYRGERLVARDLQDEFGGLATWRALHVIALHATWGIALGLDVQLDRDVGVFIGPGLAYDARGREVVLTQAYAFPWPPRALVGAAVEYDLVASYDAASSARWSGDLTGLCDGRPGREQPLFAWRRPAETRLGLEIPLAHARLGGGADPSIVPDPRRYAQRASRPHVAGGITSAEQRWQRWEPNEMFLGLTTTVDTRDAGFVGIPQYFASLQVDLAALAPQTTTTFAWLTAIAAETATSFDFRIVVRSRDENMIALLTGAASPTLPRVRWLGVEPVAGCRPEVDWMRVRNLVRLRWNLPLLELHGGLDV